MTMQNSLANQSADVQEAFSAQATQDFIAVLENTANTYDLLSRLFRVEVDQELLDNLLAMKFPAHNSNEEMALGYKLIREYLGKTDANTLTDLAIDYVRTFIGSGNDGFSAAYPYESVYTSPKRLMMQEARDEVLVLYHTAGLEKQESWKESEDHIALELEFLSILTKRALEAFTAGDEERCAYLLLSHRNFIEDHIQPWFPMMAADMYKYAKTGLYLGLGHLTSGMIEEDLAFLNDVVEEDGEEAEPGRVVQLEVDITPAQDTTPTKQDVTEAVAAAEAAQDAENAADAAGANAPEVGAGSTTSAKSSQNAKNAAGVAGASTGTTKAEIA